MLITIIKKRVKMVVLLALTFACSNNLRAQTPQQVLESIYQRYDTLSHLTFDVKYTYASDTVLGDFTHDVLEGTYTMAGKKALYRLGDIEFMQNDSFFIAVYNNDKFILVSDPNVSNAGNLLPLRTMMDSLMQAYASHYTITNTVSNDTGKILFVKADSLAQFQQYSITYDATQLVLHQLAYSFYGPTLLSSDTLESGNRNKKLTIDFSNYRFANFSATIYDINNYIFFEGGLCKPVDKYKDYKVYYSKSPSISVEP